MKFGIGVFCTAALLLSGCSRSTVTAQEAGLLSEARPGGEVTEISKKFLDHYVREASKEGFRRIYVLTNFDYEIPDFWLKHVSVSFDDGSLKILAEVAKQAGFKVEQSADPLDFFIKISW